MIGQCPAHGRVLSESVMCMALHECVYVYRSMYVCACVCVCPRLAPRPSCPHLSLSVCVCVAEIVHLVRIYVMQTKQKKDSLS